MSNGKNAERTRFERPARTRSVPLIGGLRIQVCRIASRALGLGSGAGLLLLGVAFALTLGAGPRSALGDPIAPGAQRAAENPPSESEESGRIRPYCGADRSIWRRARTQTPRSYCEQVRRAVAVLSSQPEVAQKRAQEARRLVPDGLEAWVVLAESHLALSDSKTAHDYFSRALDGSAARTALLEPRSLTAAARAALLQGDYDVALRRYRQMVLVLDRESSPRRRAQILVEAATAASYQASSRSTEAQSYLQVASLQNAPLLREVIDAAAAIALLRGQKEDEARRRVAGVREAWGLEEVLSKSTNRAGQELLPVFPPGEAQALLVGLASLVDPEAVGEFAEAYRAAVDAVEIPAHIGAQVSAWEERAKAHGTAGAPSGRH